jgi:hypothetical protein
MTPTDLQALPSSPVSDAIRGHPCAAGSTRSCAATHGPSSGRSSFARRVRAEAGPALAAAVLAQAAWLAQSGDAAAGVVLCLGAVAAAATGIAWEHRARWRHADAVLATVAFGGMAMLAANPPSVHHHAMQGAMAGVWSLGTGVMVLACVSACLFLCDASGGWRRRCTAHLAGAAGMVAGMALAATVLAEPFGALAGSAAGMHLAAVLGMAAGTAASLWTFGCVAPGRRSVDSGG